MKAIVIDDEKPALAQIEWLIERDGRLVVAGKFTSAREGIMHLEKERAEIVFLDIEMPGMNGLEAAEHIRGINPEIRIVYITAYSNYAIEAFDLHALDYLLKPVHPERFKKTVARIIDDLSRRKVEHVSPVAQPMLSSFRRLEFQSEGKPSIALKQLRTLKAQELFAYLLEYQDQWVSKERLLDTLWPGGIYEKTTVLLHTSVYQIRKLIKDWNIGAVVEYALDSYRLTSNGLLVDRELFERGTASAQVESEADREAALATLALYVGDYLQEHDYEWARPRREALRSKYVLLMQNVAKYEAATGRQHEALKRLVAIHEQDPYSDEICLLILNIYDQLNDYDALLTYYDQFAKLLRDELNSEPEPQIQLLVQAVREYGL
ncbi:response regulator [Cohnella abietis]|uniref:Response regulatory domain-containing protein n=1 Tax=Cohnella abietis TaxID=2507935 RepID=A0A3T1CYV6_9BACL|nr:response regulator [Cohnella abietis]BBI31014.1 hypothetical protein KCTCHS21_04130 [Cohnella abietis]